MFYLWRSLTWVTQRCPGGGIILECENQWGLWKLLQVLGSPVGMGKSAGTAWSSLAVPSTFRRPLAGLGVFHGNLMGAVCLLPRPFLRCRQTMMVRLVAVSNDSRNDRCEWAEGVISVQTESILYGMQVELPLPLPTKLEPMGRWSSPRLIHSVHCSLCPSRWGG